MLEGQVTLYKGNYIQVRFRDDDTCIQAHINPLVSTRHRHTLVKQGIPSCSTPYTLTSLQYLDLINKLRNDLTVLDGLRMHELDRVLVQEALDYLEGTLYDCTNTP